MNVSGTNMNCEEYREAIAADPSASFEGAGHAATCEACAAFTAEMQALDAKISKALAIDVPELAMPELEPVDDDKVVTLQPGRNRKILDWIAIAAGFAVAAIIGIQLMDGSTDNGMTLEQEILAHIDHEPGAFRETENPVSDERLSRVINSSVGTMNRSVGLITYAQSCVINGHTVPHLVMQGENGPITLILMPDESVDSASTFSGENVSGVILPHGNGSIAIIGANEKVVGEIEEQVIESVEWSI
jgi:anti-sigma factor RsiW